MISNAEANDIYGLRAEDDAAPVVRGLSAVSWPAILAGAVVMAASTLVLFAIGAGFGLASAGPWPGGQAPATFALVGGLWLIVVQWIASGLGGYLTGRLRTRWIGTHDHEVFFRDTAHGFLTWSLAAIVGAIALTSAVAAVSGKTAEPVSGGGVSSQPAMIGYDVDLLFRSTAPGDAALKTEAKAEASRILGKTAVAGKAADADRAYLAELVSARAGVAVETARTRVGEVLDREIDIAHTAKKAASATAIFGGLSMLVGAFIACVAAALGGQQRDEHP
ncbi:MAG: hypothetical protein WA840_02940 [Caulobacteraceae bacterium]